jgi:hypothetical protein
VFNPENAVGEAGKLGREDDQVRDSAGESGVPAFDAGTSVLVLAPSGAAGVEETLLAPEPERARGLLAIGVTSDPARIVGRYRDRLGGSPDPCALVRVGPAAGEGGPTDATVERVAEPANLTGLGTTVMRVVEDWEPGWQAWFDSLGPLVHHAGIGKLCQFTDVFAGRLAQEGATTFVRLDPALHDERTVHRLMGAFDAAVWDQREESGEDWRVRRR